MIKAVLFDLGDTLVYSDPEETFRRILAQHDVAKSLREVTDALIEGNKEFDTEKHEGLSAHEFYTRWNMTALKHLGIMGRKAGELAHVINSEWWKFAEFHVFPEVKGTLQRLKRRGFKLGIVTGGFEEDIEMIVPRTGLDSYFDVKVGVNTTGRRKPHPTAVRYALEQLSVEPSEAIFVGDNFDNEYVGAQNVGIIPILVKRNTQLNLRWYTTECLKLPSDIRSIESLDEIFEVLKQVSP